MAEGAVFAEPQGPFEIFLACAPGLEDTLAAEARAEGFGEPVPTAGGATVSGGWPEIMRANLALRVPSRVVARIAAFRAPHLAMLDRRARRVDWARLLRPDVAVRVEASCARSRIYHAGAAAERVKRAVRDGAGARGPSDAEAAAVRLMVRIVEDLCVIGLDCSGAPLHRRGAKQAVGKAPLRETLAAAFLAQCGYAGAEPVLDPMCGSGTFVLEAAEIAAGLAAGRARRFAFEDFAAFDAERFAALRDAPAPTPPRPWFFGFDRDAGAAEAARANAARAGVAGWARFAQTPVSAFAPPDGLPAGLVIVNPPYGARIGEAGDLRALYGAFGAALRARFRGWRVGLVTSEPALAGATGLPFGDPGPPIPHGPLKIRLYRTGPLS